MNNLQDDVRKNRIYTQGRVFLEKKAWESAYTQFHLLYQESKDYRDVSALCAQAAYDNAFRTDIPVSRQYRSEWLEKVIDIDPHHNQGQTRSQLDETLHQWAKELIARNDIQAAIYQLERISPSYGCRADVQAALAEAYRMQGQQEYRNRHWQEAIRLWNKALSLSPSLLSTLRWPVRRASLQAWVNDYAVQLAFAGVVLICLATCFGAWLLWSQGLTGLPKATPTPTKSALVLAPTSTATVTSTPSETPRPPSPTPSFTATPTSSSMPILSPTPTDSASSTATATSRPRPTPALIPTLMFTVTPTPTERPERMPTPTTPRPTETDKPPKEPRCDKRDGC